MARKSVLLIMVLVILGGLLSMACNPPDPAHCSQGFWKNRGHFHFGDYNTDALYVRGPGSGAIRDARTAELNQMFWWADQFCLD